MRKQLSVICGLLLLGANLSAAFHYSFIANGFEPSAINLGMGGSPIAAVNHWHADPLCSYGNPAFASLHKGIGYSGSNFTFMELPTSENNDKLMHKANLIGISYSGIGLLASLEPLDGKTFATETDHGELTLVDSGGNEIGSIYPKEHSNIYGLSLNIQEFTSSIAKGKKLLPDKLDLALGLNYINNFNTYSLNGSSREANSYDVGMLATLPVYDNIAWRLETALGASLFNAFNQSMVCSDTNTRERIYKRLNIGGGISCVKKNPRYNGEGLLGNIENVASFRLLGGACEEFASDPLILAMGYEAGIADMVFLRAGYHDDKAGDVEGFSYGVGLNLHFQHLIGFRYDFAYFPKGEGWPDRYMDEMGVNLDLLGLIKFVVKTNL